MSVLIRCSADTSRTPVAQSFMVYSALRSYPCTHLADWHHAPCCARSPSLRPVAWSDLGQLPQLDAAINESLRLFPAASGGSARCAPACLLWLVCVHMNAHRVLLCEVVHVQWHGTVDVGAVVAFH